MFKPTDRQVSLFTPAALAPRSVADRLKTTWAEGFQREVLPVLLEVEGEFASLYSEKGRPNWSVARLVGLMVIQDLEDLDDQAVLDRLMFDIRVQHALGISGEDAYLSRRSYVAFRSRLVARDPDMVLVRKVFDRVRDAALADLRLSAGKQRVDSTQVVSNIQTRGRSDLFGKTLRHFVRELSKRWPERLERVAADLTEWALADEDGWFGKGGADQRVLLQQRAEWALAVVEEFAEDKVVKLEECYRLVVRLLAEHCVVEPAPDLANSEGGTCTAASAETARSEEQATGEPSVTTSADADSDGATCEEPKADVANDAAMSEQSDEPRSGETGGASAPCSRLEVLAKPLVASGLQSPFDPDAGYGSKGRGYLVHVTETCGNHGTEIITDYGVVPANVTDNTQVEPVLQRLPPQLLPHTLFADGGYATTGNLAKAREYGTTLYAPFSNGKLPDDFIGRDRFVFDEATGEVTRCPEGHRPKRHGMRSTTNSDEPTLHAYFDGVVCRSCPLLGRCAVRGPNNGKKGSFHLELLPNLRERDEALARQSEPAWWQPYRIRSGVEGTQSELKREHGLGRLRVRRRQRVTLSVAFKVIACNAKRWIRAVLAHMTGEPEGPEPARATLWATLVTLAVMGLLRLGGRYGGHHGAPCYPLWRTT